MEHACIFIIIYNANYMEAIFILNADITSIKWLFLFPVHIGK